MELEQSKKRSFTKTDDDIYQALPCRYTKGVFRNLCFHRNANSGLCCPAIDLIAYEEEFERRQVMDAICFMKFAKVITPKKHWKSYHYIIHDDDISYLPNIKKILNEKSLSGTFKVLDDLLSGTLTVPEDELSSTLRVLDQVLWRYHNNIKRNKMKKTTTTKASPKSAPHAPLENSKSSSSSFFESNKEKEVPVHLLETIGFTIGHVSQIASKGILTIEEIIESIKAYANVLNFDSKKAKAIKDPLAYFMGILKNGNTYLLPESTKKAMTKKAISPKKPLTEEERRKYENEAFRRTKAELLGNS